MKNPKTSFDNPEKDSAQDETFLRRWSKRKLHGVTEQSEQDEVQESLTEQRQLFPQPNPSSKQPQSELTDEDMPPLETLDENSDFSGFFSPKVSEALRRQAFRKLFHLPQFNIADGLNDYDEDYTQFESLGNVVTQEMKRLLKRQAQQQKEKESDNGVLQARQDAENNQDAGEHQNIDVDDRVMSKDIADSKATEDETENQTVKNT